MKNKKCTRTCVGCRTKKDKADLVKIVRLNDEDVKVDFEQKCERQRGLCV